jgi:hypothetical protein
MLRRTTVPLCCALLFAASARAADFYVDPVNGSAAGDGSAGKPWRAIQEVIAAAPIKAGDTIWLRSGYHGVLSISGRYNREMVRLAAQPGHTPTFAQITVTSSANWHFRGLHISPSFAPEYVARTMFRIASSPGEGPVRDIVVEDSTLFSVQDTSSWTLGDWSEKAANAFQAGGTRITIRGNHAKNVNFGISVTATHSLVEHNVVENFAGDGMRGLGDHTVFQYNTVKNCYDVNANHDDGFQSWSVGSDGKVGTGVVTGVVLRGNRIINYEDPNQPFRGTLQGIGLFDGTYDDWIIENNVVITDHWHGITVLGARNTRVVNNTVLDANTSRPGPPWIMVAAHKNGTPPENCIVRNNLATAFRPAATGVVSDHNIVVADTASLFVNAASHDVRLRAGAAAIDAGSATLAPAKDIEGTPRPQGSRVDVGACEWRLGSTFTPRYSARDPRGSHAATP